MNDRKNMIHDAGILFLITLIAGLLLGLVYEVTKEPIARQEEAAKIAAYQAVFEDAAEFTSLDLSDKQSGADAVAGQYPKAVIDEVMVAKDASGSTLGYVVTATSKSAYDGSLQLSVGIRQDGTVNGISFQSLTESAGLGMEADTKWKNQYADKNVESFAVTKVGAVQPNEIDAISGATITSKAVTEAVNASLLYFREALGGGVNE